MAGNRSSCVTAMFCTHPKPLIFWGIHPGWQKKGNLMCIGFCGTIGPLRISPSLTFVRSSQKTPSVFTRVCGPEEKAPGPGQPSSLFRQGSTLGLLAASFCRDGELLFCAASVRYVWLAPTCRRFWVSLLCPLLRRLDKLKRSSSLRGKGFQRAKTWVQM